VTARTPIIARNIFTILALMEDRAGLGADFRTGKGQTLINGFGETDRMPGITISPHLGVVVSTLYSPLSVSQAGNGGFAEG
jgi:hypothetical protein